MPDSIINVACGAYRALASAPAVVGNPTPRMTFSWSRISFAPAITSSSCSVYGLLIEFSPFLQGLFKFRKRQPHGPFPSLVVPARCKSRSVIGRRRIVRLAADAVEILAAELLNVMINISGTILTAEYPFVHPGFQSVGRAVHHQKQAVHQLVQVIVTQNFRGIGSPGHFANRIDAIGRNDRQVRTRLNDVVFPRWQPPAWILERPRAWSRTARSATSARSS